MKRKTMVVALTKRELEEIAEGRLGTGAVLCEVRLSRETGTGDLLSRAPVSRSLPTEAALNETHRYLDSIIRGPVTAKGWLHKC